ncbi:AMP-binding protein [Azospirillum sp.]|uniref:AMP-binding protein n=1 Tax=Azospirillum sp. TaxID=34012 RepID=UPI003D72C316
MTDASPWDAIRAELTGPTGLNMGWAAADRHAALGHGEAPALRWIGRDGAERTLTYTELAERSSRFADALRRLGVGRGEAVFTLLPRVPDLVVAVLGTLKAGCVAAPLYAAFGPEPLRLRLALGRAGAVVTTAALWRRKGPLDVPHALIAGGDAPEGTHDLAALLDAADPQAPVAPTGPDDPALLHFTSGTTGAPKGALTAHDAVVAQVASARLALDLRPGDVYWCTADPGWVTGTVYGVLAPLACGATVVLDEGDFDAARWYGLIERQRVAVWYSTPTAIRLLMRAGDDLPRRFDLSSLRHLASVGEPLNPEVVLWSRRVLGPPFHDTWWQTETGSIMLANRDATPGVLGSPLPGIEAAVWRPDAEGVGELVLRPPWPSLFRGYLDDPERTAACFAEGWYRTGDLVRRGADGLFRFVGRADDVIKASGHRIGPFEVESVLLEHSAVAEAGVIGKPDPVAGETVKAFVALKPGAAWSDALAAELLAHARRRLGPALAPKEIAVAPSLPHTRSGKILRRLLKTRELGLPDGDLSTLEDGAG